MLARRFNIEYAALKEHDLFHVIGALFFCSQGAMGRRVLKLSIHSQPMAPELGDAKVYSVLVESALLRSTQAMLSRQFGAGKMTVED